eukprot:NODE_613_length_847_cov_655.771930_g462_i0.p1 GENE.NODE_613_length_847_cov_655.771930_g462_i0~~NODE_613_length_847_cov_655.771930_g462_i0.p1  ORF type:complete len:210 (-),score=67.94 NODE_613_length_847_cov_655.771930_g462_i0:216-821(-)
MGGKAGLDEQRQTREYQRRKDAAMVALNKEKQSKALYQSKQRLLQEKQNSVANIRKQKEINMCRIHIYKEEERDKNLRAKELVKQTQDSAKEKKRKQDDDQKAKVRSEYESRIAEEEAERERKEKLATQLVTQEAQLIYRLKRMHMEKQNAIRDLAQAVDVEPRQRKAQASSPSPAPPAEEAHGGAGDTTLPDIQPRRGES